MVNVVTLEKVVKQDADVMPLGKITTKEKEGHSALGSSMKKGKEKEGEDAKVKRKRKPRRKFKVLDLPLGEGQVSYDLKSDVVDRKANITFGKLMEIAPKLK